MNEKKTGPRSVVLLSDGIRGHKHQSLGVAQWLERLCGASIHEIEVPRFSGLRRFCLLKLKARHLDKASPEEARRWLQAAGFGASAHTNPLPDGADTLFISTGSSAAPFCLALSRAAGGRCATVMTPSVLGTRPFDFAIIPEHDHPVPADNLLTTLGAPNHIYRPNLQSAAEELFAPLQSLPSKIVALLLGGGDANYELTPSWVHDVLLPLRAAAEHQGAALLVTTSRRTGRAADEAVKSALEGSSSLRYLLLASQSPENPIPAMLGAATHLLVTEDSVSMVSEAATAGFRVGLLRVGRKRNPLTKLRKRLGGGTARFDALFEAMAGRGLLEDLGTSPDFEAFLAPAERQGSMDVPFNEAKRAAEWILSRWDSHSDGENKA